MVSIGAETRDPTIVSMSVAEYEIEQRDEAGGLRARVACRHCGLDVPVGLVQEGDEDQFCCAGCRAVYGVIHGSGLGEYYRIRSAMDERGQPASPSSGRYEAFDDPVFLDRHAQGQPGGTMRVSLYLEGVHCKACVWLVERVPSVVDGVIEARLDFARSLVVVTWDPAVVELSRVARALDRLGYRAHPMRGGDQRTLRRMEDRRALARIAAAGALAGNVMLLGFALYSGMFGGMAETFRQPFRFASMVLAAVAIAWPGRVFFVGALAAIRARRWHLDLPIALGLTIGMIAGTINTLRGTGEIYFDSLTMLVFLLLVGRWVQRGQQRRAADAVELLYSLTPSSVRLIEDGTIREVPIEAVCAGDRVEVRAHETIPVDGVVEVGSSSVDASVLTGESRPMGVQPGEAVAAGAINLSSRLEIRATAVGDQTRLGQLMRRIEEGAGAAEGAVELADRLAGWFVVAVLSLAAATMVLWLFIEPADAVTHTLALLIVTCPCALALATPMAVTVAMGRASRRGIYIKTSGAIERLAKPGLILLDKTGTITHGGVHLVRWIGDEGVRSAVAALEEESSHPIARALAEGLETDGCVVEQAAQVPGRGITGRVDGIELVVGSSSFVAEHAEVPGWAQEAVEQSTARGQTPTLVARAGRVVAVAVMGDAIRDESAATLRELVAMGWRLGIVSGDDPRVVEAVAASLGVAFEVLAGGVSPDDKPRIVAERLAQAAGHGPVVFVGDGVNDAAAMLAADVGIAVQGGAEASLAAADVYLTRAGLGPLVELIGSSRRTMGVIQRNIAVSLVYNAVAASLAVAGLISPLLGAVLMPISSLTVLGLSIRGRTFGTGSGVGGAMR